LKGKRKEGSNGLFFLSLFWLDKLSGDVWGALPFFLFFSGEREGLERKK
jgi:hypothetical protein